MESPTSSLRLGASERLPPSLDTLVSHLLAAKRALSCVAHVSKANDIVTSTRLALESHTVTAAKTRFLRKGSISQIDILTQLRAKKRLIVETSSQEFERIMQSLDVVEKGLQKTLDTLKATVVDLKLRPDATEEKSLVDFVDDSGIYGLFNSLKASIDATAEAKIEYEESDATMAQEISSLKALLDYDNTAQSVTEDTSRNSPVPEYLDIMEEHVKDMAEDLESLVKHFDLCVTAIKHIEGGGAMAKKLAEDLPDAAALGLVSVDMDSSRDNVSQEALVKMLQIVDKDAEEVEDVVNGIRDRLFEMESRFESVNSHSDHLFRTYTDVVQAFRALEGLEGRLPRYISHGHHFVTKWSEEKAKIEDYMQELEGLREFYNAFLKAYDSLIIEVGRRKSTESKATKILQDAMHKINTLFEEEVVEREAFKSDQGDFLPVDIWPGLMTAPTRFAIKPLDDSPEYIPDLSKSAIRAAIHRVTGR